MAATLARHGLRGLAAAGCLLGAAALLPASGARAAAYTHHGHYGFLAVTRDEVGAAMTFEAALAPVGATNAPAAIRGVHAVSAGDGWQVYVGGWPATVRGVCDLHLQARAADGSVRTVVLPGAVTVDAGRMDVALLLDDSFSMRRTDPARLRVSAVKLFARVAAARGSIRTLTIVAFSRSAHLLLPPTDPADQAAIEQALAGAVAEGSTDMDAAFELAASTFDKLPESRKIAVVLSDGHDQPGRYEDAHLRFAAAHRPVYTVGLSHLADSNTLRRIAEQTGGEYRFAPDTGRIESIFQEIVLSLHGAVTLGEWPLDRGDAAVPVDDTVRLLTLALDAPADTRCRVTGPGSQARELAADAASNAVCEVYAPVRGPWQVSAARGARLRATAGSDLELIFFPVTSGVTAAVPVHVRALLLRDFAPVTNASVHVELATGGSAALAGTPGGLYEGWLVPAVAGESICRAMAVGHTPAGWPFQRLATQVWQVYPSRRDSLWVQPGLARLALHPGTVVTGVLEIAGRGAFSAALHVPIPGTGVDLALIDTAGALPDGTARALRVQVCTATDAVPAVFTAQVAVTVGALPPARVPIEVTVLKPAVATGPDAINWGAVRPGCVLTGRIWAALSPAGAVRVRASARGNGAALHPAEQRVLSMATSQWELVVAAPAEADEQASGVVELDWGWGVRVIPWQVTIEPLPPAAVVPEMATNTPPAAPLPTNVVVAPPTAPEPARQTPAQVALPASAAPRRGNWLHLLLIALLALIAGWLLMRLLRTTHVPRMAKYFVLSVLLHLAFLLLGLDLLVQTNVVRVEQISPSLAVRIESLEQRLGVEITPSAAPISLAEAASAAAVARAASATPADVARRDEPRQPDAEVMPLQAELAPSIRPTGLAADLADAAKKQTELDAASETRSIAPKPVAHVERREEMRAVLADAARQAAEEARSLPDVRDQAAAKAMSVSVAAAAATPVEPRPVATAGAASKQAAEIEMITANDAMQTPKPAVAATPTAVDPLPLAVERTETVAITRAEKAGDRTMPSQTSADAPGSTAMAVPDGAGAALNRRSAPAEPTVAREATKQSVVATEMPEGPEKAAIVMHRETAVAATSESGPAGSAVPAAAGRTAATDAAAGARRVAAVDAGAVSDAPTVTMATAGMAPARAQRLAAVEADAVADKRKVAPMETVPVNETGATFALHRATAAAAAIEPGPTGSAVPAASGRAAADATTGARRVAAADAGAVSEAPSVTVPSAALAPGRTQQLAAVEADAAADKRKVAAMETALVNEAGPTFAKHRAIAAAAASESGPTGSAVPAAAGRTAATEAAAGALRVAAADAVSDAPSITVAPAAPAPARTQRLAAVEAGAVADKRSLAPMDAAPAAEAGDETGGKRPVVRAVGGAAADQVAALGVVRGQRTQAETRERDRLGVGASEPVPTPAETGAATKVDVPRRVELPGARGEAVAGDLALRLGDGGKGSVSTTLGLARYGGDWDCSRTAMMFLGHQLRERTGMGLMAGDRVVALDSPELGKLPFVYLTGHRDFQFSEAEVRNLRAYLQGGGHLWADDSTHYRDETFDRAFRRELARVLPGAAIEKLGPDFKGFHTGYDLSQGYKGYAVPPGDKYRLDYIEGVRLGDRVAVVYTRNDYGDGLDIDPHTQPLEPSLTSLSPAEMQEGATRMGVNLVLYFLSQGNQVDASFLARTAQTMRAARDRSDAGWPVGPERPWEGVGDAAGWFVEPWGDPATWTAADGVAQLRFEVADKEKAAFGRMYEPALTLEPRDVLAVEMNSRLSCGARVALGLTVGDVYYETAPSYIKPGANRVFFRCDAHTFKTQASNWEYRDLLPLPAAIGKINWMIYSPAGGVIELRNARLIRENRRDAP